MLKRIFYESKLVINSAKMEPLTSILENSCGWPGEQVSLF